MASRNNLLFVLIMISVVLTVSARQFQIGGPNGWIKPSKNETETYDEWAEQNRFHIGDSIYFKYQNDSVLVVNYPDYADCNVTKPISKFNNGKTVFQFNRYGYFYFISGEPGHCKAGQKVVIRVMVHPRAAAGAPNIAPSPQTSGGGSSGGSGEWAPATPNSAGQLRIASIVLTAFGGMLVFLYLLM